MMRDSVAVDAMIELLPASPNIPYLNANGCGWENFSSVDREERDNKSSRSREVLHLVVVASCKL